MMAGRERHRLLWSALAVMALLHLLPMALIDVPSTIDMGCYNHRAIGLVEAGRYAEANLSTAFWPVDYLGFLAGPMALFETSVRVGQLGNLALSVVCALLLYQWRLRQIGGERIAIFAVCGRGVGGHRSADCWLVWRGAGD